MPQTAPLAPALSRRERGLFVCLAALLSVSCGGKKAAGGFTPPPTAVEVAAAVKEPVRATLHALGTVEATESVKISAEIDALVRELPFEEGGLVRKGQTLAVLNDSELAAEVHRAAALRNQAELNWKRADELVKKKISSSQEENNARAAFDVADANWKLAQARLAKTRIVAPFEGLVGRRLVSPGAFLRLGDVITDLARIDEVKVTFSVPERYLARAAPRLERDDLHGGLPRTRVRGHGRHGRARSSTRARARRGIVAVVPNPGRELRPGMSADVTAVLTERAEAVTVPSEAVFAEGDQPSSTSSRPTAPSHARRHARASGRPGTVEVTQGLEAGEQVVRAGHQKLFQGAKVAAGRGRDGQRPAPAAASGRRREAQRSLHPPAGLRDGDEPGDRALRRDRVLPAAGARVPRHRSADRLGDHALPRRRPERRRDRDHRRRSRSSSRPSRASRRIDLLEPRAGLGHHDRVRAEPRRGRGGQRRARPRLARPRRSCPREADDPIVAKVDVNAQPIIWLALSQRPAHRPRADRRRRPRPQGAAAAPARAWARSSSAASAATPCASGSTRCAWPPTA